MTFEILTLFPSIFEDYFKLGVIGKAIEKAVLGVRIFNIRDFTHDRHRQVDDYPYGGGAGMVIKAEPVLEAYEHISRDGLPRRVILLSPQGTLYTQGKAEELKEREENLLFICGRYEGIDERVRSIVDEEISIGDYILTGGELAALVIIDSIARLVPGALGDENSSREESFSWGILDYPHYTRPSVVGNHSVPDILLSGNHQEIWRWRRKQALRNTFLKRPDLLEKVALSGEDMKLLEKIKEEIHHEQDQGN